MARLFITLPGLAWEGDPSVFREAGITDMHYCTLCLHWLISEIPLVLCFVSFFHQQSLINPPPMDPSFQPHCEHRLQAQNLGHIWSAFCSSCADSHLWAFAHAVPSGWRTVSSDPTLSSGGAPWRHALLIFCLNCR
jgi:hypothetical protein